MSQSLPHPWPELLRITLCPDQVILQCGKLVAGRSGVEARYFEPEIIPVEPRHEPTLWTAPLAVLGIALDGLPERPHDATVILSNHFVHYPLIQSGMPSERPCAPGVIEEELQNNLLGLLLQHDCRLASLLPRIVAFGTDLLEEFHEEPGWLVLVEEGLASIGLVQEGEFTRFRNLYMWPASSVQLLSLLDQEASAAGLIVRPRNLMIWGRDESDEVVLPLKSGWQITRLREQQATAIPAPVFNGKVLLDGVQA
ncbi:MAG TPA: hypothetical protein VFF03_06570 [Rhodocyclaceae bacterium]|nr:hypothetical protein [Rhodocyclaceae bacterium]